MQSKKAYAGEWRETGKEGLNWVGRTGKGWTKWDSDGVGRREDQARVEGAH